MSGRETAAASGEETAAASGEETAAASGEETGPAAPLPGENWALDTPLADLEDTEVFARGVAAGLKAGDLLVLTGGLGAGKTTFTQSLAEGLGATGQVSSPTFVLSRIHRSAGDGPSLVHVDAYRTDAEGLESLDLLATMPSAVTVVEWGRGLVEHALAGEDGSWLDLELVLVREDAAGEHVGAEGEAAGIITDFSESEEDLLGTPRQAILRGYGPRWASAPDLV